MDSNEKSALIRLAHSLPKGSEERRDILSRLKMGGDDFKRADQEMTSAATKMGSLLGGRPDVATKIRDALKNGPYKKSAQALFDAYEKAQRDLDLHYMY